MLFLEFCLFQARDDPISPISVKIISFELIEITTITTTETEISPATTTAEVQIQIVMRIIKAPGVDFVEFAEFAHVSHLVRT